MRALLILLSLFTTLSFAADSLYSPTKNAFISGKAIPNIAVVDIEQGKQIDTLSIPIPARIFASATDAPYLAFSDKVDHALYTIELTTRKITRHPMPSAVYRLLFFPNSQKLGIVLEKNIAVLNYQTGKLTVIDKPFQNLYTRFNTIFSIYSQTVWVMQENTPLIYRYRLDKPEEGWQTIDIGETRGLGSGAPSFEDKVIAFNTYYAGEGMIYFNDTGKLIRTGDMYNSRPLNERMVEPYIDNGTRHVIFGDKRGQLKIYDLNHSEQPIDYNIGFPPRQFKTGWLDQYLIVGGDQALGIYPFANLEDNIVFRFGYEQNIADMWVSGDSKVLLFGTERSRTFHRYDLQKRQSLPDIELKGIAQIGLIRMNTANTVCY